MAVERVYQKAPSAKLVVVDTRVERLCKHTYKRERKRNCDASEVKDLWFWRKLCKQQDFNQNQKRQ